MTSNDPQREALQAALAALAKAIAMISELTSSLLQLSMISAAPEPRTKPPTVKTSKIGNRMARTHCSCLHCEKRRYTTLPNNPKFCWPCHKSLSVEERSLPKALKLAALKSLSAPPHEGAGAKPAA